MPFRPLPPMEADEHRGVVRSLIGKLIVSTITGLIAAAISLKGFIHLDAFTSAIIGFLFFFCIGDKFFPESTKFIRRRARNYRRVKRGLEPLDVDDEPSPEIISDFQRKG
ncbi:MAG: hypothetical protein ACR2RV_19790 [Verrucomicrobiales bacterium]